MPAALPLLNRIEQTSSKERVYKTLSARFGNGYGQSIPDGINDIQDSWSLSYTNLSQIERDTLMSAINAVKGWDYLTWLAFGDTVSKKWKVVGPVRESFSGLYYNVSFNIEQTR